MLKGKNILLGVCGSIAAYKAALIVRLFVKKRANVKVLMTPSSVEFITPLTLSTLSKNTVYSSYVNDDSGDWNNHVELAKWADYMLIAPATQNTIAKMAQGVCDNLLLATYFSMRNPVYVAPAMDLDMFSHKANQENMEKIKSFGNRIIPVGKGELASGLHGEGRMAEVEDILSFFDEKDGFLSKKKILITAGPTYEQIDPVRFIGNHSSGKMGFALAEEAKSRGAYVILISGPTHIQQPGVDEYISVSSAEEMFKAVEKYNVDVDGFIMSAAVSDYKIAQVSSKKIKKRDEALSIKLDPTKDILKFIGENKKAHQFVVGFALETDNEESNAREKMKRKNCDLMVLNSMQNKNSTFNHDTNKVSIFDRNNNKTDYELKPKSEVAVDILDHMEKTWGVS